MKRLDRTGRLGNLLMARAAESNYRSRLLQVARQVDSLIKILQQDPKATDRVLQLLRGYADLVSPWAETAAAFMVADVARRNLRGWEQVSQQMAHGIRSELAQAPTGAYYSQLMREQVDLIKSLPLQAAQRIHDMTTAGIASGRRAEDMVGEILGQGAVSASRARLIARTEVARAASTFTQARARYAGSEGYIWRTSADGDVRPTHRAMNGKFVRWDDPPKTDKGLAPYHAGCGPNCRCYPDPILPE